MGCNTARLWAYFIFVFLMAHTQELKGQFGFSASYDLQDAPDWESLASQSDSLAIADQHYTFSVNYWFRLKNTRIEFLPELSLRMNSGQDNDVSHFAKTGSLDVKLNTQVYLFDLGGDCNCPTFSKQGNFLQKGFYVAGIIGGSWRQYRIIQGGSGEDPGSIKSQGILAIAGLGTGLDIGLSDLVTVSPWANYEWHFGSEWERLSDWSPGEAGLEKSPLSYLRIGIRLLFRPDYRAFR